MASSANGCQQRTSRPVAGRLKTERMRVVSKKKRSGLSGIERRRPTMVSKEVRLLPTKNAARRHPEGDRIEIIRGVNPSAVKFQVR